MSPAVPGASGKASSPDWPEKGSASLSPMVPSRPSGISLPTSLMRSMAASRGFDSEDAYIKEVGKEIPLGRLGTIDEAGDLAVFLASEASKYITGTEIVIDGGNIIQEHK